MRDEKEGRKKQARSNKQTRQSNTAHPRQSMYMYMYMYMYMLACAICTRVYNHFSLLIVHAYDRVFARQCVHTCIHAYYLFP